MGVVKLYVFSLFEYLALHKRSKTYIGFMVILAITKNILDLKNKRVKCELFVLK